MVKGQKRQREITVVCVAATINGMQRVCTTIDSETYTPFLPYYHTTICLTITIKNNNNNRKISIGSGRETGYNNGPWPNRSNEAHKFTFSVGPYYGPTNPPKNSAQQKILILSSPNNKKYIYIVVNGPDIVISNQEL